MVAVCRTASFVDVLRSPGAAAHLAEAALIVVDARVDELPDDAGLRSTLAGVPVVLIARGGAFDADLADIVTDDDTVVDAVAATVRQSPQAATALAMLLRDGLGLVAESATYSTLQAGPEFAAWLASRPPRPARPPERDAAVRCERDGGLLRITLSRPHVHNAFSARMRDELIDALLVAADPTVERVELRGDGPSFCSGGDLDEFGTFPDPATAHVVRLGHSAARALGAVRSKVTAYLHGACIGSGIELAALAGRVVADGTARIALPEVGFGLIPGAGGTVSLPRRIGRHRTALLALTGMTIDAATAAAWGLVDECTSAT